MNERIRELRRQATLVETYTTNDGTVAEGKHVDLEKFAELIVRECIEWCDTHATINGTAQQVRDSIKQHFGVES